MNINLNDYVSGGYYITKYRRDRNRYGPDLLPPKLLSLSPCVCDFVHVTWTWDEYREQSDQWAVKFGIAESQLDELAEWQTCDDWGRDRTFHSLGAAQRFIRQFLSHQKDIVLIGAGLNKEFVGKFLREIGKIQDDYVIGPKIRRAYRVPNEYFGLYRMIAQGSPLDAGGKSLGFDVVGHDHNVMICSWLCTCMEYEMSSRLNIRANAHGLWETYHEAKLVYAAKCLHSTKIRQFCPWLIVKYPLETTSNN